MLPSVVGSDDEGEGEGAGGAASDFGMEFGGRAQFGLHAWGPQDWFSANPRLDSSAAFSSQSPALGYHRPLSSSASFPADTSGGGFFELAHGVMERYDLEPAATHTHTHLHHHHAAHAHAHEHDFSRPR
ncbi:hypothetical protein B0H17DRAFT_1123481, partial [Mycena rosella]